MNKILQTNRYLMKSFSAGIIFGFLVILGTVAITDWIFFLTDRYYSGYNSPHLVTSLTVPFEFVAGIFALLIGLVLFIPDFKVALANGISRRTYFLSNLSSALVVAAAFPIFTLIVIMVHGLFWPINSIIAVLVPDLGRSGFLMFQLPYQFALYFLLIMAGRLITLAYYRSSTPVKWIISLAPFVLFGLLLVEDAQVGGTISRTFDYFLHWMYPRTVLVMLVSSAILYGLIYLLIRRAPLKN